MLPLPEFYGEKITQCQARITATRKTTGWLSLARFIVFLAFGGCVYLYSSHFETVYLWVSGLLLILFFWLIRTSLQQKELLRFYEQLLFVNTNELGILRGQPNQFDNGNAFQSHESYFDDLDIFGPASVFHLLNRTTTTHGSGRLASRLSHALFVKKEIEDNQEAVRMLSGQPDKRQQLTANGLMHDEHKGNLHSVTDWLKTASRMRNQGWLKIARWAMPVYNLGSALYALSTGNTLFLLGGVLVSLMLRAVNIKYMQVQHLLISQKQEVLDQYAAILKIFGTVDPGSSSTLQSLQATTARAYRAIKKFAQLSSYLDQGSNLVILGFLTPLFMYDTQCLLALEKWKEENKAVFEDWINCVGDIEYFNSIGGFAFNNPSFAFPMVQTEVLRIEATQMAHPLIPGEERIFNDFSVGDKNTLQLVTGSNMSGKTTFLRSVGVNLVLAQCGSPVCAGSFSFSPMDVLSSIRVSDSLQEHTSYFMAELKRLQQIIGSLQTGRPALVLIDEILRGTNSEDKTNGSEQFIRKLLQYRCVALFATHDLSLSVLETEFPGIIDNYCFESTIDQDTLHFDYTLRHGVAKNKNATFLMKKMEII